MEIIHRIPIVTTILSAIFLFILIDHLRKKPKAKYLIWWALGVFFYGLGTAVESLVGLFGWTEFYFKTWYIVGALLGGAPLAQGTIYLLLKERIADRLSIALILVVIIASVLVILTPINYEAVETYRLTGSVMEWQKIRLITPFINIYAFIFLVGGAAYSAYKYAKDAQFKFRAWGNILIAIGGLLPGIGGSFTKFGYTEVLYITELHGIILIFLGYLIIKHDRTQSIYAAQQT